MNQDLRKNKEQGYLTGQLLIATPQLTDQRFHQAILLICAHDENGAMGLILNKYINSLTLSLLLEQLEMPAGQVKADAPIHFGGPVEMGRGFVLHSVDYYHEGATALVTDDFALTATVDVLKIISYGNGPKDFLCALGYSGWSAGQLEMELQTNSWLQVDADPELIFKVPIEHRWRRALDKLGINPDLFSLDAGHA